MKNNYLILVVFIMVFGHLANNKLAAQEYLLNSGTNGTTINTCSGTLYDSGGPTGNYQNNELYQITLCSNEVFHNIELTFTHFQLEQNYDIIYIFDGPTTSSPLLLQASGSSLLDSTITSSGTCLTIRFSSDGSVSRQGFAAEINCTPGCQNYTIDFITIPESQNQSSEIKICQGESVTFIGDADFPNNGSIYQQSIDSLVWSYSIFKVGESSNTYSIDNTNEFEYIFDEDGCYRVLISAYEINNCQPISNVLFDIIVSAAPDFSEIFIEPSLCLGESIALSNNLLIEDYIILSNPFTMSGFCISDDLYSQFQYVSFNINGFFGQVISSPSDITSVCIELEHSYIGELDIILKCPNGQYVELLSFPNGCGRTHFGIPIEDDSEECVPGVGMQYCWTPEANQTIPEICGLHSTIPEGDYLPITSFSNLIGCPIAGEWKIGFRDNLYADDGTVFFASINFLPELILADTVCQIINNIDLSPESTDVFWSGPGIGQNSGVMQYTPMEAGEYTFILSATTNHDCTYTTEYFVTVYDDPNCFNYCVGSDIYTNSTDTINDGSYEFPIENNSYCEWLINVEDKSNSSIHFYWNYFDTYPGDILRIYAGPDETYPLLYEFYGNNIGGSYIIPGNIAFLTFETDDTFRSHGWELVYETVITDYEKRTIDNISIFPNPSNGVITIKGLTNSCNLTIIDNCGKALLHFNNFYDGDIDMSSFDNGIYFLKIESDFYIEIKKLIKH